MRVLLDTNVFISGIFFTGHPFRNLRAWREGILQMVVSLEIFDEVQRGAEELAVQFPVVDWRLIVDFVTVNAKMVSDTELGEPVCGGPDDDKFIACALVSKSNVIATGDKHLLKVSGFRGVRVSKLRGFVETYISSSM